MATKAKVGDKFANVAYMRVTESAAGTLTWAALNMANNLMGEKFAIVIHRAETFFSTMANLNSTNDFVRMAITVSQTITDITDFSQPELLWYDRTMRIDYGTAATGILDKVPNIRDFTALPGGGLLVPADRLYIAVESSGAAAAMSAYARIFYTVMPLDVSDYWELIEARRIMTT